MATTDPIIVIGDFNAICHSGYRMNGVLIDAKTVDFKEFMLNISLVEAKSTCVFLFLV